MKRRTIIIIHLLFWFYMINQALFPLYVGDLKKVDIATWNYLKDVGFSVFLSALTFYAVYFVFPLVYLLKQKFLAVLVMLTLIGLLTFTRFGISWIVFNHAGFFNASEMNYSFDWIWNELRVCLITGIYAVLIRFMIRAFEAQNIRNELVTQQQAGELALIKAKVNPHFLFNTLNNIYSLVYKKSDEAAEAVMKFSSIMRFVLSEANSETILLDKEIEYMKSYIELQKLRMNEPGYVVMNISGMTEKMIIAPMLLIPLVENAYKHGSRRHHPGIIINLIVENGRIDFGVLNYLKEGQTRAESQPGALGLDNIRRRLDLTYPGKHQFSITTESGQFFVKLIIEP
ncbi:MAG: sensor histidine kinase [Bacteroides sp.]|jgi:sensor histidine kinase YesM|nr:sensor histidine kinase [Bacteroides sp.]